MDRDRASAVAAYLAQAKNVSGQTWTEKRLAFRWGDHVFLVDDYIRGWDRYNPQHDPNRSPMGWTTGAILEYLKLLGIEPFYIEVTVTAPEVPDED